MIQGIILQAAYVPPGTDPDARVRQVMLFPAGKVHWSREIDTAHPKRQWRRGHALSWDLHYPFNSGSIKTAFMSQWDKRADANWHLTSDPTGFQITDDEYLTLSGGVMPRNVALRAQRALEVRETNLIGGVVKHRAKDFVGASLSNMDKHVHRHTVNGHLQAELERLAGAIQAHDVVVLAAITPKAAYARKAGAHRNADDLAGGVKGKNESKPIDMAVDPLPPVVLKERIAAPGAVKPGDRITALDGQVYVARTIVSDERNLSDVEMYRRAAAAQMNVFLYGLPGTGKTRGLQAAHGNAIIVPISGDTEVADLIGSYQPTGPDTFAWVDGPLLVAMENGRHIVLDEVGLMDPKVAAVVYPLMDGRRELLVTANPMRGTVHAKDGFSISGTTNPNAPGVRLSEALLSRFHVHIEVGTDYKVARELGVNERLVQAAEHLAKQFEADEVGWAPQFRELLIAKAHEEQFGLIFALRNLIASAPEMEREVVEMQLKERFGDLPGAARKVRALKVD